MPDAAAETVQAPPIVPRRPLVLAACLMATFMAAIESTIVSTTLPSIVSDLGGFELFSWVFTVFLLTQAVSIPIYGRLADMFGRRRVFLLGVALFLTGAVLCGFARGMVPLICFRAIEGLGAGAVQPISATILGDIYTPAERARVQGLVSSIFGVSAVLGPTLGAFLIQHVSWSVVFWINVPIGLIAAAMIALFLRESHEPRRRPIDWIGAALTLLAAGALILVLVQGARLSPILLGALAATSALSFLLLLLHESATPEPMLPLDLWRHNRIIVVGSLGGCASGAMMMGVSAFLPAYVQGAMGLGALAGGAVLGAMSVSWALASLLAARLMLRTSYRLVALLGSAAMVAGCAVLLLAPAAAGPVPAGIGSFVIGVGMGFSMSVYIVSVQAAVPWRRRGAATSSAMFLRFMGQVMGATGCGAVLNATILRLDPGAGQAMDRMLNPARRAALPPEEVAHLTEVIGAGLHNAWLLAFAFALLALLFAWLMPPRLSPANQVVPE